MKIAFVVPGFSADEKDWCIPAHTDIVRALAQTNEVHVFAMRYPHRVDEYKIGKATVHSFNGVGSRRVASARLWLRVLQAFAREHSRARFDIVHAIFASEAGCVATLAGKFWRVPSVVWMVNGELIGLRNIGYGAELIPQQRLMNNFVLRFADCVLCGCETMVEKARERKARGRVEWLPLGVELERFSTSPLPSPYKGEGATSPRPSPNKGEGATSPRPSAYKGEGVTLTQSSPLLGEGATLPQPSAYKGEGATSPRPSPNKGEGATSPQPSPNKGEGATSPQPSPHQGEGVNFVNVGSLIPVKDQSTLLRAFALVRERLADARLTIAGTGPLENELRELARELGIAQDVTFAGNVPHDELANVYRSAEVFVQASRHEGQGMAMLEAAACGCAVCGTDVGALRDMARGGGAKNCAVNDADALAETMRQAYCERVGLRERAQEIVAREYSLGRLPARLETLYTSLRRDVEPTFRA